MIHAPPPSAARRLHRPVRAALAVLALWILGWVINDSAFAAADETALWRAMKTPGHVVLIRHALAPGTGDPPQFRLGDCATQRNLSAEGRAQAARIGRRFRDNGIDAALVHSSQWCRSTDTARLLGLGEVRPEPLLNSFFATPARGPAQTERLRTWIARQSSDAPRVLVTHQVNITQLTGVFPAVGELVVVRPSADGRVEILGTIRTD